jgi:hypothetical protein
VQAAGGKTVTITPPGDHSEHVHGVPADAVQVRGVEGVVLNNVHVDSPEAGAAQPIPGPSFNPAPSDPWDAPPPQPEPPTAEKPKAPRKRRTKAQIAEEAAREEAAKAAPQAVTPENTPPAAVQQAPHPEPEAGQGPAQQWPVQEQPVITGYQQVQIAIDGTGRPVYQQQPIYGQAPGTVPTPQFQQPPSGLTPAAFTPPPWA